MALIPSVKPVPHVATMSSKLSQSQYWTPIRGQFCAPIDIDSVYDLSDPIRKLEYTEIDPTPDPAPTSSFSEAQTLYLGGRSVDDLDFLQRQIFADLASGSGAFDEPVPAQQVKARAGEPSLDVAKLQSTPLSPTARLEVLEWFNVVKTAHREAQRGIEPHLRSTRHDVERARTFCAPYLIL